MYRHKETIVYSTAEIRYLYDIGLIKQGLTLTANMNRLLKQYVRYIFKYLTF